MSWAAVAVAPMAALRQWARIVLAASAFGGFGGGALALAWVVLPTASLLSVATGSGAQRHRRCQRIVQAAFRLFHAWMRLGGLVELDPRQVRENLPDTPVVIVANHPTLVDITAVVATFGPMCYLAKRSFFRNPVIGPILWFCGQIPGGGDALHENMRVLDVAVARLRAGHRVMLFPEGTRSPAGGLHPFRRGAFEIARQAAVPIVPVVIRANPPGLYRGLAWYQIPSRVIQLQIEVLPTIATTSNAAGDAPNAKQLCAQALAAIESKLVGA